MTDATNASEVSSIGGSGSSSSSSSSCCSNSITSSRSLSAEMRNKLSGLDLLFDVIVNRVQITCSHRSRDVGLLEVSDADKNILTHALPEIEAFFLEKIRLCWWNFKTRFHQRTTSGDDGSDYRSCFATIANVEKELLSFDTAFNSVDPNGRRDHSNGSTAESRGDEMHANEARPRTALDSEPKALYNRITLLQKMCDFDTKRYQDRVRSLKNIPVNCCKRIGDGQLRLAPAGHAALLSDGFNFGKIELAIGSDGHSFAVKKLPKESEATTTVASKLITLMDRLLGLNNDNILPYTHCIEHVTELWLAAPICDYNLETYVDLMCKNPNVYCLNLQNTVKQMVNGLQYLHGGTAVNGIVHGNMKPSNVLIDAVGNIRLADFGMTDTLYELVRPRLTDIIWWSRETANSYEANPKKLECNRKSDIQTLGMIIHFTLTRGVHPFGSEFEEICENKKRGYKLIRLNNAEHHQMVRSCLHTRAARRPHVASVNRSVFLWSDQKKWDFLMTCVEVQCVGQPSRSKSFPKCLDALAANNWDSYLSSMGLKTTEDKRFINCCTPSRFLQLISNDTSSTMKSTRPDLNRLTVSYLTSFPTLAFTMVNLTCKIAHDEYQMFVYY